MIAGEVHVVEAEEEGRDAGMHVAGWDFFVVCDGRDDKLDK